MTTKLLALSLALSMSAAVASAQDTVKVGSVPKNVVSKYSEHVSKEAAKKAVWTQTPTSFTAEYVDSFVRYDNDGNVVWSSNKIANSAIDSKIKQAFNSKYASEYAFQWAEDVTLANGEKRTFIVARKGNYNYYFKYNDKKQMVEKTATCK